MPKYTTFIIYNILLKLAFTGAFCLFVFASPLAIAQDITTGLVGHWRLDETSGSSIADSAGTATGTWNDGTGNSVAEETIAGKVGTALSLAGTNDRVSLGTPAALNMGAGDYTLAAWVNYTNITAFRAIVSKRDSGGSGRGYAIFRNNTGGIECDNDDGTLDTAYDSAGAYNDGNWHHIVCVRSGATLYMYIDGKAEPAYDATGLGNLNDPAIAYIGANEDFAGAPTNHIIGKIDDVRIYSRALTADEVKLLYESYDGSIRYNADWRVPQYHDGMKWIGMGRETYVPNGPSFDGISDYLSGNVTASDCKQWTGSAWFRRAGSADNVIIDFGPGGSSHVRIDGATDTVRVQGNKVSDALIGAYLVSDITISDTLWHHLMFSFDVTGADPAKKHLYIDGVEHLDEAASTPFLDATVDFTYTGDYVGAADTGAQKFDGYLADIWMDFCTYLDLSVVANREKFLGGTNKPVYLGPTGNYPTGSAPEIYLSGATSSWQANKGAGGGYTLNGTITTGNGPNNPGIATRSNMGATLTGTDKWNSGALGPDGKIYGAPINSTNILIIDPGTGTATRSALGANLSGTNKWTGLVMGPDRKLYGIPYDAADILIIDPMKGTATRSDMGATLSDTQKWGSGVLAPNGKIYGIPSDATDILIIDPLADTATRSTMGATLTGAGKWVTGVLGPDGKIYGIPVNSTDILIIDPVTETATLSAMGATLTGTWKWQGGTLAPNGKIYGMPRDATDVLIIDPVAGTATRDTMGEDWAGTEKYNRGVVAPDGKIYGIPYDATNIAIFDLVSGTATRTGMGTSLAGVDKFTGGVLGGDGKIYGIPRDSTDILIIDPLGSCIAPARRAGAIVHNDDFSVVQFCNGGQWIAMGPVPGAGGAGCSNPSGVEGKMVYNAASRVMQYCDGASWIRIGGGS